jgi:hypothetical protein
MCGDSTKNYVVCGEGQELLSKHGLLASSTTHEELDSCITKLCDTEILDLTHDSWQLQVGISTSASSTRKKIIA